MGNGGTDKQLSKGFCPEQRTKYKVQAMEIRRPQTTFVFFIGLLDLQYSSATKKTNYIFQLQITHKVFSSQGRKELKSYYIVI